MSSVFNPSAGAVVNANWELNGSVARIVQLPEACQKYFGAVVFCHEDKRFYECRHIVTEDLDYYKWIAVTDGGHRMFFIPVEKLNAKEITGAYKYTPALRTNSFDAVISALDEIAFGLLRYYVDINPLCYKVTKDTKVRESVDYYKYNNQYDRADYVKSTDTYPVVDKPYFYLKEGNLTTAIFKDGESFEEGVEYWESTRPFFVKAEGLKVGDPITELLFERNDLVTPFDKLTLVEVVNKYNEIVDIINLSGSKLHIVTSEEMDSDTGIKLFKMCEYVNTLIDEVNPFSVPWNSALDRISYLETIVKQYTVVPATIESLKMRMNTIEEDNLDLQEQIDNTNRRFDDFVINFPVVVNKGSVKYTMDFVEGDGVRMITCKKHEDQTVEHKYVFPMTIIRNGVTYSLDFDDSDESVVEKAVFARKV